MKRFYQIQEEYGCGGAIICNNVRFYTLKHDCTIIAGDKMKGESMEAVILRVCNEAIEIWNEMPEAFAADR